MKLNHVILTSATEMGVALIDVNNSDISHCAFEQEETSNEDRHSLFAKSGLFIEGNQPNSSHAIDYCNFTGSGAKPVESDYHWEGNAPFSRAGDEEFGGAGLSVHFSQQSSYNFISVADSLFEGNTAKWGGAIDIVIQDSSRGNTVVIKRSEFKHNRAQMGGGAIFAGLLPSPSSHTTSLQAPHKISIVDCIFTSNAALVGGGIQISHSEIPLTSCEDLSDEVEMENCTWIENEAHMGAAIDVRLTKATARRAIHHPASTRVILRECKFENNTVKSIRGRNSNILFRGEGTVRLQQVELQVQVSLSLKECTGSALYLDSSMANFANGSESSFTGNKGHHGAAVAMMGGMSTMSLQEQSSILFQDNRAESIGGALFQESSWSCFLAGGNTTMGRLSFDNNTADDGIGHSVFVKSLKACMVVAKSENYQEALDSIAGFEFMQNRSHEVATFVRVIVSDTPSPLVVAPGKEIALSLIMMDETNTIIETNNTISTSVLTVSTDTPGVEVAGGFSDASHKRIKVLGRPGGQAEMKISPYHQQEMELLISLTLSECPPGYYYDDSLRACACSAHSRDHRYIGMQGCNADKFRAYLQHSHWAGYVIKDGQDITEKNFKTTYCPLGFCTSASNTNKDVLLPSRVNKTELSAVVCSLNRTGILCGSCIANHSAFFPRFGCHRDAQCEIGWLYYILSQILPVTILFTVIVAFDVSLTGGEVSGFILFAQMFDSLLLTGNNFLWFQPQVYILLKCLRFIFRMINLQFFALQNFSFCLWRGATALDIFAFNYITFIYSLLLVIGTVKVVIPCVAKMKRRCLRRNITEPHTSVIHGLSSFLVLCYSQCTNTSLHLLASSILYGEGGNGGMKYHAFYNGELEFFKGKHLAYAIPAVVMVIVITILPPLLLISYPLCYRAFALCRIQESKITKLLCYAIPLEKYKPLFDSFQGAFKDEHHYFSGLYFVYRLVWLLTFASIRELASFYVALEIELVLMLALTAYVQPYKKNWHNKVDTFVFAILAVINACTIYNYHKQLDYTHPSDYIYVVSAIQMFLSTTPLLYMIGYVLLSSVRLAKEKLRSWRSRGAPEDREESQALDLLGSNSREVEEGVDSSVGYERFQEKA